MNMQPTMLQRKAVKKYYLTLIVVRNKGERNDIYYATAFFCLATYQSNSAIHPPFRAQYKGIIVTINFPLD